MSATSTIPITIGTTLIQFPNSGASPLWSPAIIQFAEAVAIQLQTITSPFNVAPTVMVLPTDTIIDLNLNGNGVNLSFPNANVRGFTFTYAVYCTSATPASNIQYGTVSGIYNSSAGEWSLEHDFQGDAPGGIPYSTFSINSSDQLLLSKLPLGGASFAGTISYSATTELVSI